VREPSPRRNYTFKGKNRENKGNSEGLKVLGTSPNSGTKKGGKGAVKTPRLIPKKQRGHRRVQGERAPVKKNKKEEKCFSKENEGR